MRRIAVNWPIWITRQVLRPLLSVSCTVRTRSGLRIFLSADHVDDLVLIHTQGAVSSLYFPPSFEPVPPGGVLLDVGAHHGVHAVEALRRNPQAQLIAIEPDPDACRLIARQLALNGFDERVEIIQAAIGSATGVGWLQDHGSGSWGQRVARAETEPSGPSDTKVRVLTILDVLRGRTPHTVKISAGGAEFALIPQMLDANMRPQQFVVWVYPYAGAESTLRHRFNGAGYQVEDTGPQIKEHTVLHCRLSAQVKRA